MKTLLLFLKILVLTSLLHACAPTVHTDFDRSFNFSNTHYYKILPDMLSQARNSILNSTLVSKRIRNSIHDQLTSKGYQASNNPDIYISYQLDTRFSHDSRQSGLGYGIGGSIGGNFALGVSSGFAYEEYQEVSLTISLYQDEEKSILLWRGTSEKELKKSSTNPEYIDQLIGDMVVAILALYPPTPEPLK